MSKKLITKEVKGWATIDKSGHIWTCSDGYTTFMISKLKSRATSLTEEDRIVPCTIHYKLLPKGKK